MNWKQILFKGLPVLLVAAVIVIIAAIASRPDPQPEVTKENELVFDFEDLKVTKGQLYNMLKLNVGPSILMNLIDRDLLDDYKDQIDTKELEDKIQTEKDKGIDKFYETLVLQGIIESKDDPKLDEKIEDYYLLSFLQKAYAKSEAKAEILDEEAESKAIEKAMNDYREDLCVISIKYPTIAKANTVKDKLAELETAGKTDEILQYFKDEYAVQHKDDEEDDKDEEEKELLPFFAEEFNCEYDKLVYEELSSKTKYRDFVFSDTYNNEPFEVETGRHYNKTGFQIAGDGIYFVYKLAKPKYIDSYTESEVFRNYFIDKLVNARVTTTYTNEKIKDLRNSIKLKVYDNRIADGLKGTLGTTFKGQKKLLDDNKVIATYKKGDETVIIKADDLYQEMKTKFGVPILIDIINYEALKTVEGIQLSKSERQKYIDNVKSYKAAYSQQPPAGLTWHDYLALYHGAFSEEQLIDMEAGPTLIERFLLGYKDYAGVSAITDQDIQTAYDKWFSIEAYHILFEYNPDQEDDTADDSLAVAMAKAQQVIDGCQDDDATCYINYDIEPKDEDDEDDDTEKEDVPFVGFEATPISDWTKVFKALATEYSDDESAASNGGYLNYFGPGQMVEKFEETALDIVEKYNESKSELDRFGVASQTEIKKPNGDVIYGVHVIYVTNQKTKTAQPTDLAKYKEYVEDLDNDDVNTSEKYTATEIKDFNAYRTFEETLRSTIRTKRIAEGNENKQLAILRDEAGFQFKDADLQKIYTNVSKLQKEYEEK